MTPDTRRGRCAPASFRRVMADFRALWVTPERETHVLGRLKDYGLSIHFVEAGIVSLMTCGS
jgi:hypothetical protein